MLKGDKVICDYCGQDAVLTNGETRIAGMRSYVWHCSPCDAWVGAYSQSPTKKPFGRLANAELRKAKTAAHSAFDPLWQAATDRRSRETGGAHNGVRAAAYQWLAHQLGIEPKDCHFAMFDLRQCQRVVEVCNANTPTFMHGKAS